MAYTNANWACISSSMNQGQETVNVFNVGNTVLNAPNLFMYASPNDTAAQIGAANYFLAEYASLYVGDWILGFGTDTSFALQVTAVSSTSVTTMSVGLTTSIGTANIVNNAVTYAKIQEVGADKLLGNPTAGTTEVSEIGLAASLDFVGTNLGISTLYQNYIKVNVSAAQWNAMYTTPVSIIPAPGANTMVVVDKAAILLDWGTTQFTGGGVVGLQYGNAAQLAGPQASATQAAADFNGKNADSMFLLAGAMSTGVPIATVANAAVFLSNATAVFATGDSDFEVQVWYSIAPTV